MTLAFGCQVSRTAIAIHLLDQLTLATNYLEPCQTNIYQIYIFVNFVNINLMPSAATLIHFFNIVAQTNDALPTCLFRTTHTTQSYVNKMTRVCFCNREHFAP